MSTPPVLIERRADKRPHPLAGKYLTFVLAEEEYGLSILQVREIVKMLDITRVPQVAGHVRGVVNLRGKVIPVVDLRLKLGFEAREYTDRTCIIVVEVASNGGLVPMGLIVDAVSEVVNIATQELHETPRVDGHVDMSFVKAVAKVKGSVKMLIDLERTLNDDVGGGR